MILFWVEACTSRSLEQSRYILKYNRTKLFFCPFENTAYLLAGKYFAEIVYALSETTFFLLDKGHNG